MTRASYRASQFVQALFAQPAAEDARLAAEPLPASLRPLFHALSRAEQSHAVAVLRCLLQHGERDPDLLAAALLHDVGKTRAPLRLLDRVLVVLAQRLAPAAADAWSKGEPRAWRRPRPAPPPAVPFVSRRPCAASPASSRPTVASRATA